MKITFIGGGNMAIALIGGSAGRGSRQPTSTSSNRPRSRDALARALRRALHAGRRCPALAAQIIVLAVKPQQMKEAVTPLAGKLTGQLVVSIAAGMRMADISRWLGGYRHVVRTMPNTPALIGAGVTGLCADPERGPGRPRQRGEPHGGRQHGLDRTTRRRWTPSPPSPAAAPAYVFYFLEAMEKAALDLGFDAETARRLSVETFPAPPAGGAEQRITGHAAQRVTSKGGTTEAALLSFDAARHCRRHRARNQCCGRGARARTGRHPRQGLAAFHACPDHPFHPRYRLRLPDAGAAGALRHAVGARAVPQSAGAVHRRRHRLDGASGAAPDPGLFGLDMASLLLAWLWQVAYQGIALGFSGVLAAVSPAPTFVVALLALLEVAKIGLYLVIGAVIVSAVFSWVNPLRAAGRGVQHADAPLLRPFRRFIPPVGGVDLSPLALLLVLQIALFVLDGLRNSILPLMLVAMKWLVADGNLASRCDCTSSPARRRPKWRACTVKR
jgi:pyrroline-5-carboxylate reductase